jgi:peptidoglycan hydrolase-like protein with peptidoglycan-binding domain
MNVSEYSVFAHKEWAPSRKIDPAGIEMNAFRANVKKALDAGLGGVKTPAGDRWLGLTNPPMTGQDVKNVQNVLRAAGNSQVPLDGVYGRVTADVLAVFQKNRGITERGCGPKTWAALRAYIHNR